MNVKSPNNISKWQMGFNTAFKGLKNFGIYSIPPTDYHLLPGLQLNLDGHTFKDDGEVETAVTRWLITHDRDCCQHEFKVQRTM
jgi:hypothetical protein